MRRFILIVLLLPFPLFAAKKVLNIYNWANYMPHAVIHQFEKETGIHINYSEYDSNEMLYAKLKTNPTLGYDIIVPSSYYVRRMANEGMLRPLDKVSLPNLKNLNPVLLNRDYDPGNQYSLPYTWGATGIVVNDQYFNPQHFHHWGDLWKKKYRDQLLMLDDMREVFSMALILLGYSINDTDPAHIKEAYEKLRVLLPNIKLFNSDAEENIYVDEDATLGLGWNGEIFQAYKENPHLHFIYPEPHFVLWIDCVAIPKYAPHFQDAERFINFINRPDIAAKIAIYNGFSSPNLAAIHLQPKEMQDSPVLNPSNQILKNAVMENDLGPANTTYEKYWELLKLGG
ncbi:MAG: spermidine/putrescine ABC transporter substrate-binding protein [Coxiella sp. RIFCSPHIGHO2_12_FULL_42_15]|nr:MAG: spermidine/putrescine ABC transporter substrate-binding protein [Coxiella sp. RIFCSPHIGHO2_12_FULL_42_15]